VHAELRDHRHGQPGHEPPHQRSRRLAPRDHALEPPQRAPLAPAGERRQWQRHVLMCKEHGGKPQVTGDADHLARGARGGLRLDLDQVGPLVAQQRQQGPPAEAQHVGAAGVAHRHGKYLDPVLPLPRDLERAAQHPFLAPPLRHADGDVEPAGRERAQLAPVGRGDVGVGDDEDAHEIKCGMRNVECGMSVGAS